MTPAIEMIDSVVLSVMTERVIDGVPLDYPLVVRAKPAFTSARWTFDISAMQHRIWIGVGAATCEDHATAIFLHELAHAELSCKGLKLAKQMCRRVGIPFRLFNLMEDCRVEHRFRQRHGLAFGWTRYEPEFTPDDAPGLLYAMAQRETPLIPFRDAHVLARVQRFYQEITECTHSMRLEPILLAWRQEFGTSLGGPAGSILGHDMENSAALQYFNIRARFDQGAVHVGQGYGANEQPVDGGGAPVYFA